MLSDEYGTASNIKSRVNRLSVLSAITSAQQRLKLYNRVPNNGLVVFVGTVLTDEGKDKKLSIHFEPFKPINTSLYLCDNKFHTEALDELLEDDNTFGFIVMDGNGCLYGTVSGNTRRVLHKFGVELPKKHGRGGQSAVRFARLRKEARHNYVRKCAELATQNFISQDKPTVEGLVLAGSAAFKNDLRNSDLFDGRLKDIVIKVVDVSYGGENGFNQAIELAGEALADVKFVAEKKLLSTYYTEIAKDTGMYCFGVKDTMIALESSALERLIVFEELEGERLEMRDPSTDENIIKFFTKEAVLVLDTPCPANPLEGTPRVISLSIFPFFMAVFWVVHPVTTDLKTPPHRTCPTHNIQKEHSHDLTIMALHSIRLSRNPAPKT